MSGRPAAVRLDDLADPRYGDDVRAILDFMEDAGSRLALEPASLKQAATAETGLEDFGAADFEARLELLCRAMREEGGFNGAGVLQQHTFLAGLLKNRLLIEDLVTRHPEILDQRITAPVIICGLPRTGTTHLHNLMSADPALRSLPYWESLEPVLAEREQPKPGQPDPRLERTAMALGFLNAALPYFTRMHEMTVEHAHEEIQLLAIDFSTMLFETVTPMPLWRDGYLNRNQRPSYGYLVRVLQVLQWLRGGTRWVLKSPQHLEQFPVLTETFPDATFVVTHRDPVSVTASMVTMLAYSSRLTRNRVDVEGIGRYWSDRLERMLRQSVADHDGCPPSRRSTCTSTSSWPTTSAWSNASTTWPASRSTTGRVPQWPPSWPNIRGALRDGGIRPPPLRPGPAGAPRHDGLLHGAFRGDEGVVRSTSHGSANRRTAQALAAPDHVDSQVDGQGQGGQRVPAHEILGKPERRKRQLGLVALLPVHQPRDEHVEGQEGQDEVREGEAPARADPHTDVDQPCHQARRRVPALADVHHDHSEESQADEDVQRRPGRAHECG